MWCWTRWNIVGVPIIHWVWPQVAIRTGRHPFACHYWRIALRSFFRYFGGFCVLVSRQRGFGIFFSTPLESVTTNKHSSVLHRLIGRVMDFTDASRTEPNTRSPLVQRTNLNKRPLHNTTDILFAGFWAKDDLDTITLLPLSSSLCGLRFHFCLMIKYSRHKLCDCQMSQLI